MKKVEQKSCSRCLKLTGQKVPAIYHYGYPLFPKNTVVSLCVMCYKKLNENNLTRDEQKNLLEKYI